MIRRPPRSTPLYSSAASDVYKRQVLNPADDYVADFIKDINRSRVLTVGTLPLKKVSSKGITLSNDTSLEDAMKALVEAKKDSVTVVKGDEKLGSISMYDIVHAATRSS